MKCWTLNKYNREKNNVTRIQKDFEELQFALATRLPLHTGIRLDLLAWERLALFPVGCGTTFFIPGATPNLTGGAGPVLCGISAGAIGCCGIGGTGGA